MEVRPVTALAQARSPEPVQKRPQCAVSGLVFDALVGLPNPPTVPVIAHWTDLSEVQVRKAIVRLRKLGLLVEAGCVPRNPRGRLQTYRAVNA